MDEKFFTSINSLKTRMINAIFSALTLSLWLIQQYQIFDECYVKEEHCACLNSTRTVTCNQELSYMPISVYFSKFADNFTTIKIYNKNWTILKWESSEYSFDRWPRIILLTLSGNSIRSVDDEFFKSGLDDLNTLELDFNQLKDCFKLNASKLMYLSLIGNQIEHLDEGCFKGLNLLQIIYLNGNLIKNFDWQAGHLDKLDRIEFSYNQISAINARNLNQLKVLEVSFNMIKNETSLNFSGMLGLTYLGMSKNSLTKIPDEVGKLVQLEKLKLNFQFITSIKADVLAKLSRLEELEMNKNLIKRLTNSTFSNSSRLISLKLNFNQIELIDSDAFVGLSGLKILDLSSNRLNNTSSLIYRPLSQLQYLNLSWNYFSSLEDFNLVSLNNSLLSLDLSYNQFNYINRDWLFGLYNLTTLNMTFNSISSIDSGSFDSLTSLVRLDLSNNCLFKIDSTLFKNLIQLETLVLSNNVLASLDSTTLSNQARLLNLNLENNQIWARLSTKLFQNLTRLESLNLNQNHLKSIDSAQFEGLQMLQSLFISNNYLSTMNNSVDKLVRLKELDLSSNKIKLGREESPTSDIQIAEPVMNRLENLSLSNNLINFTRLIRDYKLTSLQKFMIRNVSVVAVFQDFYFFNSRGLKVLDMSNNSLGDVDLIEWFNKHITTLEEFHFSNMSVKSSHLNFSNLENLTILDLSFNSIVEIRVYNFRRNIKLKSLDLSHNIISFIERQSLSHLGNLVSLDLSYNFLKTLEGTDVSINRYPFLTSLNIINNLLNSVSIDGSKVIRSLDLSYNKLSGFSLDDRSVYDLLGTLNLSSNLLEIIYEDTFKTGIQIVNLDLSKNSIRQIMAGSFSYLNSLENLYLDRNQLTSLNETLFESMSSLSNLQLQENKIETLKSSIFSRLKSLEILNISFNNLKAIESSIFANLNQLVVLDISGNFNMDDFTEQTFDGLTRACYIGVPRLNQHNFEIIKGAFRPELKKRTLNTGYYRSIDILYSQNMTDLTESDCRYTLELIKVNLKLNLYESSMFDNFVANCQSVFQIMKKSG